MLNKKQIKLLTLLDDQVINCHKCSLYKNGNAKPFWSPFSKYAIIGEAPGFNEVKGDEPFVGQAGKILTDMLFRFGYRKSDFLIINSVNCRPTQFNPLTHVAKNAKPKRSELESCRDWLRKYLKIVNPEKILCLGNYAKYYFTDSIDGIMTQRGTFRQFSLDDTTGSYPVLFTVHPAFLLYNEEVGLPALEEDIKLFKEFENKVEENWNFKEEEFNI